MRRRCRDVRGLSCGESVIPRLMVPKNGQCAPGGYLSGINLRVHKFKPGEGPAFLTSGRSCLIFRDLAELLAL